MTRRDQMTWTVHPSNLDGTFLPQVSRETLELSIAIDGVVPSRVMRGTFC